MRKVHCVVCLAAIVSIAGIASMTASGQPVEKPGPAIEASRTEVPLGRLADAVRGQDQEEIREARDEYVKWLVTHYGADSRAGRRNSWAALHDLDALLAVWNPIGFSRDDVIAVLGEPTESGPEQFKYSYDTGRIGGGVRFRVLGDGRVYDVSRTIGQ